MQGNEITELIDQLTSINVKKYDGDGGVQAFCVFDSVSYNATENILKVRFDKELLQSFFGLKEVTFEG